MRRSNHKTSQPYTRTGRPPAYRPEMCVLMEDAMATGLSAEAAAASIGIGARTLYDWQRKYEDFWQAIQEGRQRALLWWELRALDLARGKAGNAAIVSLGLRNRSRAASGWHDAHRLEHSGLEGPTFPEYKPPLDLSKLSREQRSTLRDILLAAKAASEEDHPPGR